jgi:hypothetical protein
MTNNIGHYITLPCQHKPGVLIMTEPAWDGKAERTAGDRPADAGGCFEDEGWEEGIVK